MEVATAEVKLLEERLHATEKGAFLSLARIAGETLPNRLPSVCGARSSALKDIAAQTDEVRKRMADKVRPPTSTPTPACAAEPLTLVFFAIPRVCVAQIKQRDAAEAAVARIKREIAQNEAQMAVRARCVRLAFPPPHPTPPPSHPTNPPHPTPTQPTHRARPD